MVRLVVAVACLALVAGCSSATEPTGDAVLPDVTLPTITDDPASFPGDEWERADEGEWDALDADLAANASTCVSVVHRGRLVHDASFNGGSATAPVRTYSITKSLTALLLAMGVAERRIDLDASASEIVEEWRGSASEQVTVRDLMAMTSGREWSEQTDRTLIRTVTDQTAFAIGLRQAEDPGEWVYDNAAPQVLERVLAETMGDDVVAVARERLLAPLGMSHTRWPTDRAGHATTYSGVESTCQDLARVGYLVLQDGRWKGRQLVPADLVAELTQPSSDRNAAYGLLWWTNAEGRVVEVLRQAGFATDKPPYQGRLAPHVPDDAVWAFGYGNQYVAVVPSLDLVAVRLGRRPASPERVTFDSFTRAVIGGLE